MTTAGVGDDSQQRIAEIRIEHAAGGQIDVSLTTQRALRIVAFPRVIDVIEQGINCLIPFEVEQAQRLPFFHFEQPRLACRYHVAIDGIFRTTIRVNKGHRSLLTGQKVGCYEARAGFHRA